MGPVPTMINKCLLQPNHPWHAGHTTWIGPVDPRELYKARLRNRDAARRALKIVKQATDPNQKWGPHIAMTALQKFQLFLFIKTELLSTHLLPVGSPTKPPTSAT